MTDTVSNPTSSAPDGTTGSAMGTPAGHAASDTVSDTAIGAPSAPGVVAAPGTGVPATPAHRLPPVAELATLALALVVVGGVFIASYAPRKAPLELPIAMAAVAGALTIWNAVTVARLRHFARATFRRVFGWALLAYVVSAGMLEYVFVYDDVPGATLAVLTVKLVLFALNVPMIIAYTVARYDRVDVAEGPA